MHVYFQKSTSTILPRNASALSGCELIDRAALNGGKLFAAAARYEEAAIDPRQGICRVISSCDAQAMNMV
jgi:hypothetical protein